MASLDDVIRELVIANRILAREGVVDAFGHVSVRHPDNPDRYFISRSRAPELIEAGDIMEFTLDGEAIDLQDRTPYGERMIHGAIFELRPEVNSVVHNHSCELIPFGVTGAPLRPIMHTCAVIGSEIPRWDIRDRFGMTDHLVVTMEQGRDLAKSLAGNHSMLMKRHGSVVVGRDIKQAVMCAIYMQVNARMQLQAMQMGTPEFLEAEEVEKCIARQHSPLAMDRAWEYWALRAGAQHL